MTEPMPPQPADPAAHELSRDQADATIRSKPYIALLVVVAVISVIVSLADPPDPAGAVHAPPARARLPERTAEMVATADPGDRRTDRGARDCASARQRGPHPRRGAVRWRALRAERPAGSDPRGPGHDRVWTGARPGGSADRDRRGVAALTISLAGRDTPPRR
jgi:hypothetical protein